MFLQGKTWVMDIIRELLAWLDYIVYSIIKWILYIIFDLATLSTSSDVLNGVYSRIYVILGVFMAFKLSFSFFQYLINPEAMMDKKQGVSKLFSHVVIMLAALILLPSILFGTNGGEGLITRAQRAFLPMLPRILLGVNPSNGSTGASESSLDTAANDMAVAALGAFFMPSQELDEACGSGTLAKTPALKEIHEITDYAALTCHKGVVSVNTALVTFGHSQYYKYSYTYVVSLIVGVVMVVTLLGMCIDVAKRVFKLIILEVIAPIPIMSLIDPDSASKGAFSAWLHQLIFTFLDIFIKIGILYLIILLIQLIVNKGLFTNFPEFSDDPVRAALLLVALIIGLIFFAKEAPKFIKDSLGIKDKGDGGGFMGKFASALGGAAAGFAAGAMHGDALSGMIAGAQESYNAQPGKPSHAFRAGGDKAAQLRTGDKNYKTGFGASLQRARGRAQGYTTRGFADVKSRAKAAAADVADKQAKYEEWLHSGDRTDMDAFNAELKKRRDALTESQNEQTNADKAQKAYESALSMRGGSTVRSTFGDSASYRAHRAASNTVGRGARRAADAVERVPILGAVVRTADSARQQHGLNQIANGSRADNYDVDAKRTDSRRMNDQRASLDHDGTLQSNIKDGLDAVRPGANHPHDGHIGHGGSPDGASGDKVNH